MHSVYNNLRCFKSRLYPQSGVRFNMSSIKRGTVCTKCPFGRTLVKQLSSSLDFSTPNFVFGWKGKIKFSQTHFSTLQSQQIIKFWTEKLSIRIKVGRILLTKFLRLQSFSITSSQNFESLDGNHQNIFSVTEC